MADVTTAGRTFAGRKRVRANTSAGVDYRTFPARLPALLGVLGGALSILGALGAGVRASAMASAREDPKQVGVLMGHGEAAGWLIAAVGLVVAVSALAWARDRVIPKIVSALATIGLGVAMAVRLASFDERAATWAEAARRTPDFVGYHAGLGWGAWLLLVGSIVSGFALLIGTLRALDRRKGIA